MTVVVYRSVDTSAPVLSGTAGALTALLDACLVTGYGSKAAAGWTKPYTGTNQAAFRMGAGNQFYLNVDDSAAQTAGGREANLRGYEAMTAIGTGTNPFPTTSQIAAPGGQFRKSSLADATARAWILAADNKTFLLFVQNGDTANRWEGMYFGEFYSLITGDPGRCILIHKNSANSSSYSTIGDEQVTIGAAGHYIARPISGAAGSQGTVCKFAIGASSAGGALASDVGPSLDGNYYVAWYNLGNTTDSKLRGRLRGIWRIVGVGVEGDTFSGGSAEITGRSFHVLGAVGSGPSSMALETSDTWDTSS